jgi:hypothetical protein
LSIAPVRCGGARPRSYDVPYNSTPGGDAIFNVTCVCPIKYYAPGTNVTVYGVSPDTCANAHDTAADDIAVADDDAADDDAGALNAFGANATDAGCAVVTAGYWREEKYSRLCEMIEKVAAGVARPDPHRCKNDCEYCRR